MSLSIDGTASVRRAVASDAFDFKAVLRPGDVVAWPQGPGEPLGLTRRLLDQRHELAPLSIFVGMSTSDTLSPLHVKPFTVSALNGAGTNRRLAASGLLDVIPVHVSALPRLLRSGAIRVDVVLLRVRPGPSRGSLSLGVIADYTAALIAAARCVIAELDERLPRTGQDALIDAASVDHIVLSEGSNDSLIVDQEPTAIDLEVAARVANLIPDRATLQLGIGGLPVAVARALTSHRDLGVHSGVVSDSLVDLVEAGVVTNAYKSVDRGLIVTGGLFGSRRLLDFADNNPQVAMRSVGHTHDLGVMAQLQSFFSVNGAIEVDLSGQVNAEEADGRYLGAVGGQVDFVRGGGLSPGGRSIIALPSTTANGRVSRIVGSLSGRPVTTPRSDVDLVVTEFGVADLRGAALSVRVKRLAAIAHPAFRDGLQAAALRPAQGAASVTSGHPSDRGR